MSALRDGPTHFFHDHSLRPTTVQHSDFRGKLNQTEARSYSPTPSRGVCATNRESLSPSKCVFDTVVGPIAIRLIARAYL